MAFRTKKKTITIAFIFIILIYIFFATNRIRLDYGDNDGEDNDDTVRPYEEAYKSLKMTGSDREVPVIIVDHHQEVVPYWYKAVQEKLIPPSQNTIVHIDAHPDMAPPMYTNELKTINPQQIKSERQLLPMMQANDVFIYSAILKGLIDRVIWVKPDWTKDKKTYYTKGFVGLVKTAGSTNNELVCICEQKVINGHGSGLLRCSYENPMNINDRTVIPSTRCRRVKPYKYIEICESKFVQDISFKKKISLFVDIDEDFFGVESGFENLLHKGISIKTQKVLDVILPRLYAPASIEDEVKLDEKLRYVFFELTAILGRAKKKPSDEFPASALTRNRLQTIVVSSTWEFFRENQFIHEFVAFMLTLSPKEAARLSKSHFCSLRSQRFVRKDLSSEFSLCHGSLDAKNTQVKEYFIGSDKDIEERADSLISIFHHIYKSSPPKFYTIARSLRDGYVPRDQQILIERVLLRSIDQTERLMNRKRKTIHDPLLALGVKGWDEKSAF